MLKNYLKIAVRNLWKNKVFTGINISGLALAIGAGVLLLLTALKQFSYDRFHENGDRIYRLFWEEYKTSGTERGSGMPAPLQPVLLEEVPGLELAIRWAGGPVSVIHDGQAMDMGIRYTEPEFFRMFSFPLLQGDAERVLADLNGVVLSEQYAKRLFGTEDPMGKPVRAIVNNKPFQLVVTGVMKDPPDHSTLRYGMVTRFENHPAYQINKDQWDNHFHSVFVQLAPASTPAQVEAQLKVVVQKYRNESVEQLRRDGAIPDAEGEVLRLRLQALEDLHFDRTVDKDGVSVAFPVGLIIIAGFILAIAAINFVNLTLGTAVRRAREVGVRKVMGASRRQLLGQFWGEALLIAGIALVTGLSLTQWALPAFNQTFKQSVTLAHPHLLTAILAVLAIIGLSGGGYPALVLSRFEAADVIKGNTRIQKPGRLRNGLMLIQFTVSVLLIACTIIIAQQIGFLRNKPLGYNQDQVVSIPVGSELDGETTVMRLRQELARQPAVRSVSGAFRNFGRGRDGGIITSIIGFSQDEHELTTYWVPVDYDFLETMEIPLAEGRSFDRKRAKDSTEAVIINETFAAQLGEGSALGKVLQTEPAREVIGVVKDFHFLSLEESIEPLSLIIDRGFPINYALVRIAPDHLPATLALLEETWKGINPQSEYLGSFLDENNERLYQTEKAMGQIFTAAALLAIVLSCMGLLGIGMMVTGQRTKGIGIRKVLGASVGQIVRLVTSGFMQIVALAILLASPLAWWAMRSWLDGYAYRIDIQWWVFPAAGLLALVIAFATLGWQSVRAATANPVDSLRDE